MQLVFSIITGIISGIISSVIATILMSRYYKSKIPDIVVSDEIARNTTNEYRIKIVNKSPFYVTDVVVQARLVTVKNGMGGNVINIQNLDVPITRIMMIDPYSSKNADNLYAIWVGISKKLDQLWADDSYKYFKVSVYCSNEWNISKDFDKYYYKKHVCIKPGEFACGADMKII